MGMNQIQKEVRCAYFIFVLHEKKSQTMLAATMAHLLMMKHKIVEKL